MASSLRALPEAGFLLFRRVGGKATGEMVMNDIRKLQQYVIERDIPGAGALNAAELGDIAQRSCAVLDELGPDIRWIHSYVTNDRVYCVYAAVNENVIRLHAEKGGFPANRISAVATIIDPSTATTRGR
jgi:hypothetical protein